MRAREARTPMKAMTAPAAAPVSAPIGRAPRAALLEVLSAAFAPEERDGFEPEPEEPPLVGLAPFEPVADALGEMEKDEGVQVVAVSAAKAGQSLAGEPHPPLQPSLSHTTQDKSLVNDALAKTVESTIGGDSPMTEVD